MSLPHLKKQIILKKNEERRIVAGHPWVFSNEIRETKGNPAIGDVVELLAANGLTLGVGFYNPHSLIAFRLISKTIEEVGASLFAKRITQALALRKRLYPESETFRLIYGESDFLPGLIVDKYNNYLAVQTFSFGMDSRLTTICDALEQILHPAGIVERNEAPLRTLESLPLKKGILRGEASPTTIIEHGIRYIVDLLGGQKTGFFLDHRENRATVWRFSKGANVLDCFCNQGGFALNAARAGAASVLAIDSSDEAIKAATANAELNGLSQIRFEKGDVFEKLKELGASEARYDVVVLDPPSFTKSKKNVQTAKKGYKELHASAFKILSEGGVLLTSSCSHHIEPEVFLDLVAETATRCGRQVQLLEWRGAAPDHPVLPVAPETRYLKFGIFRAVA